MYIPLDTQHDPALDTTPIYPYDIAKAQALLKASGYTNQPITVLYANDEPYFAAMAPGIQQQLSQIGLNVSLRGVSENSLLTLAGPLTGHQINFDLWSMDYPDGYDVYTGAMSCGANIAGSYIGAKYCDSAADTLVTQAENLPLGAARDALLRKAQARILTAAAEIPLVFEKSIEIVNPRVKGFYYQPAFGWQFENYSL
jgi:ABC-type transport system substrate-binding protein